MKRIFKWGAIGLAGLFAVVLVVGLVVFTLAMRTVQPDSGTMNIAGLGAQVKVTRDTHGIPHIVADTQLDAVMALGFTHAQDRLWQMNFLRMTGQGRLSEILGKNPKVQEIDLLLRSMGFSHQVKKSFEVMKPETRALLEAYASGVNAFLQRDMRIGEPGLPPEFLILGHKPEPWKPEHSLVILKILSLQLSMNMDREVKRLQLAAQGLSSAEIDDVLPYHRDETPRPLPDLRQFFKLTAPVEKTANAADRKYAGLVHEWSTDLGKWASNNWVLSGTKTQSGKPLLANDPHLSFGAPSLWYLAHLTWTKADGSQHNVIGATIPAVPAVVLGRNDKIAWGFTNAGADVQDVFVEQLNPDDPTQYKTPDGWRSFETRDEIIKVKGDKDITFLRRVSRHGPVLPPSYKDHGTILPDDLVLALQWTGFSEQDRSFEMVNAMSSASSVAEFARVVETTVSPMQAIVVADVKGSIGLFAKAEVPLRSAENAMRGRAPVPGWLAKYDWVGKMQPSVQLGEINPSSGSLGTANSKIIKGNEETFYTYDWDEPFRQDRVLQTMVNTNEKLGPQDMIRGQTDSYSTGMAQVRDTLLSVMDTNPRHSALIARLKSWDGHMDAAKTEPLIMASFFRHALLEILDDDLGPVFDVVHTAPAVALTRILKQGGARDWCDRRNSEILETCGQVLAGAFEKALAELTEKLGPDQDKWKWGSLHAIQNEHQPFGKVAGLKTLFNIERPVSGGAYSLLRAKMRLNSDQPYKAVWGAGYRAVYDFSDLNKSHYIQSTGQSGNLMSSRYRDQVDKWIKGEYLTMTTSPGDYEKDALGVWMLKPK